eukprot:CAMPEP_0183352022 /NCGR_PEP_ID=MMETSP0164_2-20130417/27010_1 /TAXON_ID=221442 /ORGANISM="Coccolithus pelagicus ssp braarudi, Strain PLY182g" /LENGTH=237 /DNA_ID=CAMNT_0025524361 /DNA_START=15 /DNA_END=728 /DNA_ORIENTATION=+
MAPLASSLFFCAALSSSLGAALTLTPHRLVPALSAPRTPAVRCAYNPTPSKARPKKSKSKAPKEKVKGPTSAAQQLQLVPEQIFFEGAPSITETLIPGLSLFTVVGVIPFTASLARQAWTRYKITNKRLEVASGFQGKDVVQVTWREIMDAKWLRRYGGAAGDLVLTLRDGAKLELRSVPEFDRNLKFMMDQLGDDVAEACEYPDGPAKAFLAKVEAGEEPPVELPPLDAATEEPKQ